MIEQPDHDQDTATDMTALLGSRICHDLISPLGAIGNGVELLVMAGGAAQPEVALIAESVQAANARIRLFRAAFGAASPGQRMGRAETLAILADLGRAGRIRYDWQGPTDAPRAEVKLAFLALLCLESALPWGGDVTIRADAQGWTLRASAERIKNDPDLWNRLIGKGPRGGLQPAHVQFALLPDEARRQGRMITLALGDSEITIGF